jgi:hypothetical protein
MANEYKVSGYDFVVLWFYSWKYHIGMSRLLCAYGKRVK